MEEKNPNSQPIGEEFDPVTQPGSDIPEDMPQFDLASFGEQPAEESPAFENLFDAEEPAAEPAPAFPVAEELPADPFDAAPTAVETPEEPAVLFVPEESSEVSALPEFEVPAEDAPPAEESIPAEEESPAPEAAELQQPAAPAPRIPGFIYPAEDDTAYSIEPAPAEPAVEPIPVIVADADLPDAPAETPATEQAPSDPEMDREFGELFEGSAAPAEPAAPKNPRPVRKGRPKRKKGDGLLGIPNLLATLIWLGIIVMIGVSLGRMLWVCAADVLAFGRESKEVVVTIESDDTIDEIAETLQKRGLIRYAGLFRLYASIAVDEGEIAPGTYTLNTILDYHALVGQMSHTSSSRAVVEDVLIPEGYNCRQIFELLEQNGICTVKELEEYAANGEFQDFWFLEGVERGDKYCLEGYLFPDTYDFYAGSTPREALGKMLLGFEARFTEELYSQLPALNDRLNKMMRNNGCSQDFIDSHQIGLRELLTVASLIEEETAGASESPKIASVIYNRLTQDQEHERYLGIDAATIYATGDAENIDNSIDHPYNTYKNAGLTPGPISNPGLDSINAALNFLDTDYYYYVLNPSTGEHQFSETYEEHQEWIEKFKEMEPTEG